MAITDQIQAIKNRAEAAAARARAQQDPQFTEVEEGLAQTFDAVASMYEENHTFEVATRKLTFGNLWTMLQVL